MARGSVLVVLLRVKRRTSAWISVRPSSWATSAGVPLHSTEAGFIQVITTPGRSPGVAASFDELRRFSLGPRVIGNAEVDAIRNGGMIIEKKDLYGIGLGINKNGFAEDLERVRAGLAGIGNDAVGDFQAVDVSLILLISAKGAAESICNET